MLSRHQEERQGRALRPLIAFILFLSSSGLLAVEASNRSPSHSATALQPANTSPGQTDSNGKPIPYVNRTIKIDVVVLEQQINYNRLRATLPTGQIYALLSDVVPADSGAAVKDIDPAGLENCERLTYSPWHALAKH